MRTEQQIRQELDILKHEYENYSTIYDEKVKRYQENVAKFGALANTSEMDYIFNLRGEVLDKITLLEWVLS